MPDLFYSFYDPSGLSIPETARTEHALGRALLSFGLQKLHGLSLSGQALEEAIAAGPNGKPYLKGFPGIHFNITHCEGLAVCGFHTDSLGIDAELPGYFAPILIKRALAPSEKEHLLSVSQEKKNEIFFRYWTLKEAYVKQTGTGVDVCLTDFSFTFTDTEILCSTPGISCFQTTLTGGQVLSAVYAGTRETVKLHLV